jgi:hypothetical protein
MRNFLFQARLLFFCVFLFAATLHLTAQVTTSTLGGTVTDNEGKPLSGATVEVSFPDAGIKRHIVTQTSGGFLVPNLRVGGPYTISVSFTGFSPKTENNIFLDLGQTSTVDFRLETSAASLGAVTVTSKSRLFNENRTGPSLNINSAQIRQLPTISRSADDFTRLTPSASATYNGVSFAGRNGQYNNYSLDGAVFNNPFGLDAPTPGGQAGAQPISLDAIDQIQVNIAPYDVTQAGFTGASINSVTKSGTNKTFGTVYGFFRNQSLTGHKVEGNSFHVPSLHDFQGGASLGGAIKKNKLFYFVNFESQQRTDANSAYVANDGTNQGLITTSRVLKSDLDAVSQLLLANYGYVTGPYQDYTQKTVSYKWIGKLDWMINDKNTLTFTYNGLNAYQDKPAHPSSINRRGPDAITLQFQNSGYRMNNQLNNFVVELKTNFNSTVSNNLRVINTFFHDFRNPLSTPFPVINITKNNVPYIIAGEEPFSIHNILNQHALQVTDNVTVALSEHTLTFGASYEQFTFANSFNLTGYGFDIFNEIDLTPFLQGGYPAAADVTYAKNAAAAGQWTWSYFTVAQAGVYAQDAWKLSPTFKLTYGLRVDKPIYFTGPGNYFESPVMNADGTFSGNYSYGMPTVHNTDNLKLYDPSSGAPVKNGPGGVIDNSHFPKGTPLFSPRVGFNWNVNGENKVQVRGGSGLFTGRFPFVWLGNQIENPFSGYLNVTARNFHFPQVWRTSAGVDYKINPTTVLTVDLGYTKDVHAMMVQDYGLGLPTGTLNSGTADHRAVYLAGDKGSVSTYVFGNNGFGYSYNATLQVTENLPMGLYLTGSYNYQVAKDANSISAEISGDAFDRNPIVSNPNKPVTAHSLYGNTHRFVVAGVKRLSYKWGATSFSIFSNWTSGNRFSYTYAGDLTNSSPAGINALLYVPTQTEIPNMQFATYLDPNGVAQGAGVQQAALERFIEQDKYLSKHRGQYTERNGGQTPWFSRADLRILQDFKIGGTQTIELSFDVVNLGNLINSSWGVIKYASTSGYFQPIAYAGTNGSGVAQYQFDPAYKHTFTSSPDLPSRWQMQFGMRYSF